MKKTKLFYRTFTGLFALMMIGSAIPDIISHEAAVKGMHDGLGYPLYFIPFIGIAKLLGAIALIVPGFPRIKEWAYAGFAFDLTGATFSIIASGGNSSQWGFMIVPVLLLLLSYMLFLKRNRQVSEMQSAF